MEFFDIHLSHQKFVILEEEYKVLLQLIVVPLEKTANRILVLQSKANEKKIKIVAWSEQKKVIIPIACVDAQRVIDVIKQMPFGIGLEERLSSISYDASNTEQSLHFETLSSDIDLLLIGEPAAFTPDVCKVELGFNAVKLIPDIFAYGAIDGLRIRVYFELGDNLLNSIKNWGILTPVRIYINDFLTGEVVAQNTKIIDRAMSFYCELQISAALERRKSGWMRVEKINPVDLTDFLVSTTGERNVVAIPENYSSTTKWFVVVTPIIGLVLEKDFGIGNVQFCTSSNQEILRVCAFSSRFSEYETFALVNVNSDTLYHAVVQAKNQIEQSVDLLVNMLKDDSIYSTHAIGEQLMCRCSNVFEQKIVVPSWVYVEDPFTAGKMACDYSEIVKQEKLLVPESFALIQHELNRIELLLLKANGTNDKELTPLFNSLKWIRRAWDAVDNDDKVIYSIIALEFIVSKEPNTPMMDKATRKKCKGEIRKIISSMKQPPMDRTLYLQKVCEKFDRVYTETPFMGKLRNLIERLNIPVSSTEMDLIDTCRKQRNGIVHGDDEQQLPIDKIYRLCECIGKIAFYKLLSLGD